jgi:bleomycin hydrolase
MKRTRDNNVDLEMCNPAKRQKTITNEFIDKSNELFNADQMNLIIRNAVQNVGAENACINPNIIKKSSHIFLNTLKTKDEHATDQGQSGRCWMFSGLNVIRHTVNKALNLRNFEFSQTYLFFWDKLERCNRVLELFVEDPKFDISSRLGDELLSDDKLLCDGGFWTTFADLVEKYGLVPKCAMGETWHSGDSGTMNDILYDRLFACCNKLKTITNKNIRAKMKEETMRQLYNVLVKFLGEPPTTFTWEYKDDDEHASIIDGLTPHQFKNMVLPNINMNDFVLLSSVKVDELQYYKKYVVNDSRTMVEGHELEFINLPIQELKKYAMKTISAGSPVWFAGDVGNGLSNHYGTLDEELYDTELFFGDIGKFNKGDRVKFRRTGASHAMALTGFNVDDKGNTVRWQVENSWGTDHYDGYLSMSDKWFDDNLINIVIHKDMLGRNIKKLLTKDPVKLNLWDFMAPAMRVI